MNRVVLVTGAASGLGWALSCAFLAAGDKVVLADRDQQLLQQRKQECDPGRILTCVCDVTDQQQLANLIGHVESHFGGLDVLVNNAGITHRSPAADTDAAVLKKVMAVDWQGPVELTLLALPMLKRSAGQIICIGSMAGWMPVPGRAAYCAAKSALAQFFEVLRLEVAADGVSVLMVYPSFLDTPIEQNALGHDGGLAKHARSTVGNIRSAQWMAEKIIGAMDQRRPWLFPDGLSAFASILWRVWPSLYMRLVRRRFASELQR
ncbi:SDR family oxidoreductase [Alcanivorax sp. 1008]|uniref:SDR family oxidoreductase n=1 Tax=Alcanivorax sp. 1008 TaxID=2816853 RepID=UPI001D375961|nr:SDR family oxidoreductase [Alcanivorax sp. 1008]MCC1496012.1 SDR family oxidoreductase [Alcanivorax sp. 1008]